MTVLAAQIGLWVTLGLAAGLLVACVLAPLGLYFVAFNGGAGDVADVQRFRALTEEARRLASPDGSRPLGENVEARIAAIAHFQAKKEEARRALWASRNGRPVLGARDESGALR